jgi:hypothetical protein
MSKDHRFNKKEYGYDDDSFGSENAPLKQTADKKLLVKQKPKASFKRVDKRALA